MQRLLLLDHFQVALVDSVDYYDVEFGRNFASCGCFVENLVMTVLHHHETGHSLEFFCGALV